MMANYLASRRLFVVDEKSLLCVSDKGFYRYHTIISETPTLDGH